MNFKVFARRKQSFCCKKVLQIPTLTSAAHKLCFSSPLALALHPRCPELGHTHWRRSLDGLRRGFGEIPETALVHHVEIITLAKTSGTASLSVVSGGQSAGDEVGARRNTGRTAGMPFVT